MTNPWISFDKHEPKEGQYVCCTVVDLFSVNPDLQIPRQKPYIARYSLSSFQANDGQYLDNVNHYIPIAPPDYTQPPDALPWFDATTNKPDPTKNAALILIYKNEKDNKAYGFDLAKWKSDPWSNLPGKWHNLSGKEINETEISHFAYIIRMPPLHPYVLDNSATREEIIESIESFQSLWYEEMDLSGRIIEDMEMFQGLYYEEMAEREKLENEVAEKDALIAELRERLGLEEL